MKINNLEIKRINYIELNARQKENYNFAKFSGIIADYGFNCIRLSDDYEGADFLAIHINQDMILKIQLKGRLTFDKKYEKNKDLHIAFHNKKSEKWYLYPHNKLLDVISQKSNLKETKSWKDKGSYHFPRIPKDVEGILDEYVLNSK